MVNIGDKVLIFQREEGFVFLERGRTPEVGDVIALHRTPDGELVSHGVSSGEVGDPVVLVENNEGLIFLRPGGGIGCDYNLMVVDSTRCPINELHWDIVNYNRRVTQAICYRAYGNYKGAFTIKVIRISDDTVVYEKSYDSGFSPDDPTNWRTANIDVMLDLPGESCNYTVRACMGEYNGNSVGFMTGQGFNVYFGALLCQI